MTTPARSTDDDAAVIAEVRRLVHDGQPVPPALAGSLLAALDAALDAAAPADPSVEHAAERLAMADGWD